MSLKNMMSLAVQFVTTISNSCDFCKSIQMKINDAMAFNLMSLRENGILCAPYDNNILCTWRFATCFVD